MTIDPRKIATDARRRLRTSIEVLDRCADHGPIVFAKAHEWAGLTAASSGGGANRGADVSRPTERIALASGADEAKAYERMVGRLALIRILTGQLAIVTADLDRDLAKYRIYATDIPMPGVPSLEDLNRTDGTCPTCNTTDCTGTGDDRLRRITVAESEQHLMCDPCRKAWSRRSYVEPGELEGYTEFSRRRRSKP